MSNKCEKMMENRSPRMELYWTTIDQNNESDEKKKQNDDEINEMRDDYNNCNLTGVEFTGKTDVSEKDKHYVKFQYQCRIRNQFKYNVKYRLAVKLFTDYIIPNTCIYSMDLFPDTKIFLIKQEDMNKYNKTIAMS